MFVARSHPFTLHPSTNPLASRLGSHYYSSIQFIPLFYVLSALVALKCAPLAAPLLFIFHRQTKILTKLSRFCCFVCFSAQAEREISKCEEIILPENAKSFFISKAFLRGELYLTLKLLSACFIVAAFHRINGFCIKY